MKKSIVIFLFAGIVSNTTPSTLFAQTADILTAKDQTILSFDELQMYRTRLKNKHII